MKITPRDLALARTAKKHGANYALRIIIQARKSGIPISLAFALIEQESNFRNVFGHDPTHSIPESWKGAQVTKDRYKFYKARRGQYGMQGVGPAQLTWYEYQNEADSRGGAWIAKHNISTAFDHMAALLKKNKHRIDAFKAYNGTGPAADNYAKQLNLRMQKWHDFLS